MEYIGLHTQQVRNNIKSLLLLLFFPLILMALAYSIILLLSYYESGKTPYMWELSYQMSLRAAPWIVGIVAVWFCLAYFTNTAMFRHATGARPLSRKENPRVYNIVENLTMACGMNMPKVNVINSPELNAFASGVDDRSYTVTLTTGICETLNDDELAGVVGHELTHIRNRDTRLLIISIIFVGIISVILQLSIEALVRAPYFSLPSRKEEKNNGGIIIVMAFLLAVIVASSVAYFLTSLTRFAISRKREYMADAGGAELCGNPLALASALKKISNKPGLGNVGREDIAQLYICRPRSLKSGFASFFNSLFSTHPSIESRIAYLEQF